MDKEPSVQLDDVPSVASPKVSSMDASEGSSKPAAEQPAADSWAPETRVQDWLVPIGQRGANDARSVASSAAAERDAQSIYEEPTLDATEEVDEEHHHQHGDVSDDDEQQREEEHERQQRQQQQQQKQQNHGEEEEEEEPEELTLPQATSGLAGMQLRSQSSAFESSSLAVGGSSRSSAAGSSLAGAGDHPVGSVGGGSLSGDPTTATAAAALAATAGAAVSEQQDEGEQQMLDEVALEDAPVAAAAPKEVEVEPLRVSHEAAVAAELKAAADAEEEVAAAAVRPPATSHYHSRLMQQLTAEDGEGEEAEGVDEAGTPQPQEAAGERSSAASAGAEPAPAPPLSSAAAAGIAAVAAVPAAAIATTSTAVAAATTGGRMEPLSVEAGSGSGSAGGGDEAAAAPPQPPLASAPLFPQQWYETFQGLLYMDGVDALGRPVVVVNADALPPAMKSSALLFVRAHLEPLVNSGDYVVVFASSGAARLPSMWIMGAYNTLPRPFRKHVQYIVLVRPSAFLRAVLAFMRPFISKKAARKIKVVQSLQEIAAATEGEVTLQSLGPAFNANLAAHEAAAAAAASATP